MSTKREILNIAHYMKRSVTASYDNPFAGTIPEFVKLQSLPKLEIKGKGILCLACKGKSSLNLKTKKVERLSKGKASHKDDCPFKGKF